MNEIDPNAAKETLFQPGLLTYAAVIGISVWGGVTSFLESDKPFSWRRFSAHLTSSSFAGMMTGFACQYANISGTLSFVLVGVAAHMGTPALIKLAMKLKVVRNALDENTEKDKTE